MPELEIKICGEGEIPGAASAIIDFAGSDRVFLFEGEMGAGKTTLIKAVCNSLGSKDHFSSPTFSLVNEYASPAGRIFHFDLYRLKDQEELMDIGIEDYLDSGAYCFFEWPDLVRDLVPSSFVNINLSVKENIRYIRCTH